MTFFSSIKKPKNKFRYVLSKSGLIAYDKKLPMTVRFNREETDRLFKKDINYKRLDHFCEVAHLEISNRCNKDCYYCYVPNKVGDELRTDDWKVIIDNLARAGVFQVSFGGGEPTMRRDLIDLAKYVSKKGMNLGMTTNGTLLDTLNPKDLKKYFKQINISWHGDEAIVNSALNFLESYKIPRGINFSLAKWYLKDDETVKALAKKYSAELLYLVYKPVIKDPENQVNNEEVYRYARKASDEMIRTAVDGPCVNTCLMKVKFVDVDAQGQVFPCSFVREPLGNLLYQDFRKIWKERGEQIECPFVKLERKEEDGEI